jgi:hypothetical protein
MRLIEIVPGIIRPRFSTKCWERTFYGRKLQVAGGKCCQSIVRAIWGLRGFNPKKS